MRCVAALLGLSAGALVVGWPSVWAAEETTAETATRSMSEVDREHVLQSIEATRQTDPELAAEMEQQLQLLNSVGLSLQDLEGADRGMALGAAPGAGELTGGLPGATSVPMPVVDTGRGQIGPPGDRSTSGESLPPEARKELEALFQQGTGDPNSEKDRELREQAHEILERYGIDPREMGPDREDHGEMFQGSERAWEQMAPEAREQMERFYGGREAESFGRDAASHGVEREGMTSERASEAPTHEHEGATREFEAPTHEYEAATREFEGAVREYEAPAREFEAPTHDVEAQTHEYEAPTHEEGAPTHEYEARIQDAPSPEPRSYEQPPQS